MYMYMYVMPFWLAADTNVDVHVDVFVYSVVSVFTLLSF